MCKPLLSGLLSTLLLAGFSGRERYVELDGYLNGRSSSAFADNRNVRAVLSKGTRGEILEFKKFPSGNFGLKIKVLNGVHTNKIYWVYHKAQDSDLSLYRVAPWASASPRSTAAVEEAQATETIRDTQAQSDRALNQPQIEAKAAIELINNTAEKINKTAPEVCTTCETATAAKELPLLRKPKKAMAKACTGLMNGEGELGPQGQAIYSIMAEPDYARHFTADNALGAFCPKFNKLTDSEKLTAWTWFWTSLAMEESSCNAQQEHPTTYRDREGNIQVLNPREGYGYWALERDRNVRAWRGEACSNIGTPEKQARCAIDIMLNTQLTRERMATSQSSSYWGPVRRGHSQMIPHMKRLTLCF